MGGIQVSAIQEVSGLDIETDVAELVQSTKDGKVVTIKTPGATPVKTGKITLKYVAFKDDPILKWRTDVIQGKMATARQNISIVLYNLLYEEEMRFNFKNAWPSKRSFSNFTSKGNDPVTITLTIEHEGVSVAGYNS
ncbi:MAG: phage tail protein [Chloroflexi bacterium]|nr:phage tail protein [Chloroflexota bacterium]